MKQVRIGILGAARIAPVAVIGPARAHPEVVVAAIAARDKEKAARFARRHTIPRVHASYDALLADPEIDAIYIPLPNGLHGRWTVAALEAGKHVLCEKPFAANAQEARTVAAMARRTGLVVMEAFHYRYHALADRMLAIVGSGELGAIRRIEARMCIPLFWRDIRWDLDLAGGALMDAGCYAIHLVRTLAGAEPTVVSARARLRSPEVDRLLEAELAFADGRTGSIVTSMFSRRLLSVGARVIGSRATMQVSNPVMPQVWHRLRIDSEHGSHTEQVARRPSSYGAQLGAFADAILRGTPFPTHVDDAIANMDVIDACYTAAGLDPRRPTPIRAR